MSKQALLDDVVRYADPTTYDGVFNCLIQQVAAKSPRVTESFGLTGQVNAVSHAYGVKRWRVARIYSGVLAFMGDDEFAEAGDEFSRAMEFAAAVLSEEEA